MSRFSNRYFYLEERREFSFQPLNLNDLIGNCIADEGGSGVRFAFFEDIGFMCFHGTPGDG